MGPGRATGHGRRPARHRIRRRFAGAPLEVVGVVAAVAVASVVAGCVVPPPDTTVADPGPTIIEPVPDDSPLVRGYVDMHNHMFSDAGFGGNLLCGKVWDPAGAPAALRDCPDHYPDGRFALFENLTGARSVGTHDPDGWPTFADWPTHDSLTHQQNYYEWIQRAWEGGLRVMVNHLVTNRQLCEILPFTVDPCDEMVSIRLQARMTHDLEAFIDAQHGGPGRGWFRVVESSAQAREVIAEGKLAVVMGIETSELFGCTVWDGAPGCDESDIDEGLDEVYDLGVRSVFLCHKFDNALCGVRFDSHGLGLVINLGNKLSTNRFWRTEDCTAEARDNTILGEGVLPDWLGSASGDPLPLYAAAPHCNRTGLTDLGQYALEGLMERNMLVEIDHMGVKAADRALDILEAADYPGVVSSHSWVDPTYYDRIYALGGMVAAYGAPAAEFEKEWRRTDDLRTRHGVLGFGFGTDANGFGGLAGPRPDAGEDPLAYPFAALDGHQMDRARTGVRSWDLNDDGMAHYGLLADLAADIAEQGPPELAAQLAAGAEQYLRTFAATEAHPG